MDGPKLVEALNLLGRHLAARDMFVELALHDGSATMLRFEWRMSSVEVEAVVREGWDDEAIRPSLVHVADALGLEQDWLDVTTEIRLSTDGDHALFEASGTYPEGLDPGLRLLVASPSYLRAVRMLAMRDLGRAGHDNEGQTEPHAATWHDDLPQDPNARACEASTFLD